MNASGKGAAADPDASSAQAFDRLSDDEFKVELAEAIPHLRAYGRSLSGNRDTADDLVQETMLKAWRARDRFTAGTNMRAWTFIILRNSFLTLARRSRFSGDWDDAVADRLLSTPAGQDQKLHLADVQRALMKLPASQREALILVGAGGFAYEEAAEICGVAIGTIKSRVARGRTALAEQIDMEDHVGIDRGERSLDPMSDILRAVDDLTGLAIGEDDPDR